MKNIRFKPTTNAATGNALSRAVIALMDDERIKPVPAGWHTLPEWVDRAGCSNTQMRRNLDVLIKAKKAKRQDFLIRTGKVRRRVSHYWISPEFLKSVGL